MRHGLVERQEWSHTAPLGGLEDARRERLGYQAESKVSDRGGQETAGRPRVSSLPTFPKTATAGEGSP